MLLVPADLAQAVRDAQSAVSADRNALYAREAAGEAVSHDEWMALGARQIVVDLAREVTGVHPLYSVDELIGRLQERYRAEVRSLLGL